MTSSHPTRTRSPLEPQLPYVISKRLSRTASATENGRSPDSGDQDTLFIYVGKEASRTLAFTSRLCRRLNPRKTQQPSSQASPWQPAQASLRAAPNRVRVWGSSRVKVPEAQLSGPGWERPPCRMRWLLPGFPTCCDAAPHSSSHHLSLNFPSRRFWALHCWVSGKLRGLERSLFMGSKSEFLLSPSSSWLTGLKRDRVFFLPSLL